MPHTSDMLNIFRTAARTRFAFVGVFDIVCIRFEMSAGDVGHLQLAKHRDDVAPAVTAVRLHHGWLVAALRVVGNEPVEEFLDRRRLPGGGSLGAGIDAAADFGQPILGDAPSLPDGDLTVAADSGLSAAWPSRSALLSREQPDNCLSDGMLEIGLGEKPGAFRQMALVKECLP